MEHNICEVSWQQRHQNVIICFLNVCAEKPGELGVCQAIYVEILANMETPSLLSMQGKKALCLNLC